MSAYLAPLVTKPTIIVAPGKYITRGGEIVEITSISMGHFRCSGTYPNGIQDGWCKSGRIYAGMESQNDIIRRA
jgi:hypothetical protein